MDLAAILTAPAEWERAAQTAWTPFAALMLAPFLATGRAELHGDAVEDLRGLARFARVVIGCCDCLELHAEAAEGAKGAHVRGACVEVVRLAADGLNSTPNSVARAAVTLVMHADPLSVAEMVHEDEYAARYAERLWMFCNEALRLLGASPADVGTEGGARAAA